MTIVKLDPKNDIAFKKIFGTEKNKDVLIHFLNDILVKDGGDKISEVTFLNPVQNPEIALQKTSIIDVLCKDEKGVQFIVEMQVARVSGFEKRAQYYAAKAYCNQIREGAAYQNLKEVIFLAVVDFTMFPDKEHYKSDHIILDKETYANDLKDFSFTFIELPKFKKDKVEDLKTYEEKWCYFFKHSSNPEDMNKLIENSDVEIGKAYNELSAHNWNEKDLQSYDATMKANMDAKAREDQVRLEGEIKGEARGIAIGEARGEARGEAKGEAKEKIKVVKRLLSNNLDISIISLASGLTEDMISEIKRNL